jgi:TolB-like protein/Tfp pilus assembly protein PilF
VTEILERLTAALADRYAVVRRVGGGGMADVFLARDLKHGREVALKILRPLAGAVIDRDRFIREIEIAARLHHPHILPLYDSGEADGLLYYVMPYIEEETLRARLRRSGRLLLPEVLRITRELADALDFAHARGVIHRDVKPENVLLLADHAVIADFGIACLSDPAPGENLTATGMILGTPTYMSPEQVFGDIALDGRSDQYSLACIVFEMLSGAPPFAGPTVRAILAGHSLHQAPTLSARVAAVPAAMEHALGRALSKEPVERFDTVRAFAEALEGAGGASSGPEAPIRSLLVIPFATQGGTPDTEYLSDGLSEELIHTLNALEGLRVVGRTSAFALKGTVEDVRALGRRLGVEVVLEGSVRRAGQRLRITAQLTDVQDGLQLWSERFEREAGDAFAMQDEIAAAILGALRLTLLGRSPPRAAARTANPRAYELYLRGRHAWNARTETGLRRSVELLGEALALDEGFGLGQAGLAESYVTLAVYGAEAPDAVMPLAEAAAAAALRRDPRLAEAHAALGSVQALYHWRWSDAEGSFRRALAANPAAGHIRQAYAVNVLLPRKRWDTARSELERARALEPLSPAIALSQGLVPWFQGEVESAAELWRNVASSDENFPLVHYFLGQALARMGRHPEASAALARAAQLSGGSPEILGVTGWIAAVAGRRDEASHCLAKLEALRAERYVSPVLDAQILAAMGDRDGALAAAERAVEGRATDAVWLGARPAFDAVRGEPRFQALITRMDLAGSQA